MTHEDDIARAWPGRHRGTTSLVAPAG